MIKKVFEDSFTWLDLENYFSINRNDLKEELKGYFAQSVIDKIISNDRNISICELDR